MTEKSSARIPLWTSRYRLVVATLVSLGAGLLGDSHLLFLLAGSPVIRAAQSGVGSMVKDFRAACS